MAFTGLLEDRIAVRELYGNYADAAFAGDGKAWLACWAQNCVWDTPAVKAEGREGLAAAWEGLWAEIETMAFFAEVTAIEVAGSRAKGRAYCREVSRWKDGRFIKVIGRYEDDISREDGAWKFARRTFTMHLVEE